MEIVDEEQIPVNEEMTPLETTPPVEEKPKRKRRTRAEMLTPDGEVMPRRGTSKAPNDTVKKSAEFFATQFFGMHMLASAITGLPLEVSEEGAKSVGEAIYDVVKQYDLTFITKYGALFTLATTLAMVEYPIFAKVKNSVDAKKVVDKVKKETANVTIDVGAPLKVIQDE